MNALYAVYVEKSKLEIDTYLSNMGGALLVLNSESKYLFPITPRTNPGLAVVTRNGFKARWGYPGQMLRI